MGGHLVNSGRCQARVIGTYLTFYTKHVTSGSHDVFMTGLRGWRGMEVKLQANARPQNNFQAVFVATKSDLVDGFWNISRHVCGNQSRYVKPSSLPSLYLYHN